MARAREPSATSCFLLGAPGLLPAPRRRPKTLSPLPHSLLSLPSPGSLSRAARAELIAAARRCRTQSLPLDLSACPVARLPRPHPLRRVKRPRTPCIAVIEPSSSRTAAGCRLSIRRLRRLPETTELLIDLAVSLRAEPLSFPSRLRALGHSSVAAELRPPLTSSPPSLQPLELVSERVTALRKPPGA